MKRNALLYYSIVYVIGKKKGSQCLACILTVTIKKTLHLYYKEVDKLNQTICAHSLC